MKRRIASFLLLGLTAFLVYLFWPTKEPVQAPDVRLVENENNVSGREELRASPKLKSVGTTRKPDPVKPAVPDEDTLPIARRVVRVRVLGLPEKRSSPLTLGFAFLTELQAEMIEMMGREPSFESMTSSESTFEFDIAKRVQTKAALTLELRLRNAGYLEEARSVAVPALPTDSATVYIDVTFVMRQAYTVEIHVNSEDGKAPPVGGVAIHRVKDGRVVAERMGMRRSNGVDAWKGALDLPVTLSVQELGSYAVFVVCDDYLPMTRRIEVTAPRQIVPTFKLRRGGEIGGSVTLLGKPQSDVVLTVAVNDLQAPYVSVGRRILQVDGERLIGIYGRIETDDDGRFRMSNVAPGRLRIGVSLMQSHSLDPSIERGSLTDAKAGDHDVQIDLKGALVTVILQGVPESHDEDPMADAQLIAVRKPLPGASPGDSNQCGRYPRKEGKTSFLLLPETDYVLVYRPNRANEERMKIRTGIVGSTTTAHFKLKPTAKPGGVLLRAYRPDGTVSRTINFDCKPMLGAGTWAPGVGGIDSVEDGGGCKIDGLAPGTWKITVGQGHAERSGDRFLLKEVRKVAVVSGDLTTVSVTLSAGGLVALAVRGREGVFLPASVVRVHGQDERERLWSFPQSKRRTAQSGMQLSTKEPSELKDALEPGEHTLLLTLDGYKDKRITVLVKAGKVATVDVSMEKE